MTIDPASGNLKAILSSCLLLLLLLADDATQVGAQETVGSANTEPELISVFPLGGPQGMTVETEIRGTGLEKAYAAWFDAPGLKAQIKKVEEIELEKQEAPVPVQGPNKTLHGQRVFLQVQIDLSTKCRPYFLRLCIIISSYKFKFFI